MTSKERVLLALEHREADKVPLDSWMAREVAEKMTESFNVDSTEDPFALQKFLGHDLLYRNIGFCDGFNSIHDESSRIGENLYQDRFGIKWRRADHTHGSYCEFVEHPLSDVSKWDSYTLPDPIDSSRRDLDLYRDLIARDGQDYAILGGVACTMLEGAWYLRGLDTFLMDLADRRDFVEELLEACMRFSLEISRELVRMGVDIIWWGDDLSIESGPMFDPELIRTLILSRYAFMIEEVKKINRDVKIAFHSDGNVQWLLDDLVDAGVDIINPLQPDANDCVAVKKRYGKNLCIWGNVDTRHVMSSGSTHDVIREVENVIATLGHGGGLILCSNHKIQSTARAFENTVAYYMAAEKFRNYPLRRGTAI
jgi:uroporphyrinogen decarboxylase